MGASASEPASRDVALSAGSEAGNGLCPPAELPLPGASYLAEKRKPLSVTTITNNSIPIITPVAVTSPSIPTGQLTPTSPIKKIPISTSKSSPKDEEKKDESPASWRLGLRKTGSYGALAEITAVKDAQKEKDSTGVIRSASSPRLSSSLDSKEREKDGKGTRFAYVAPTIPRRLASTSDIEEKENRDSSGLTRSSGSYTRRWWDEDVKKVSTVNEGMNSSYQRSSSFGRKPDEISCSGVTNTTSTLKTTVASPAGLQKNFITSTNTLSKMTAGPTIGTQSSTSNCVWAEDSFEKNIVPKVLTNPVVPTVVNTTATTTTSDATVSSTDVKERRRSYLTPVRDEESESQRKARSRQVRQSRRSTQGVTLTDIHEAEKTIGKSRSRTREQEKQDNEKEEKEKQDKEKQEDKESDSREDDYRQSILRTDEAYQRFRPASTSVSTSPSSSLSSSSSSSPSSNQLNRPNSLMGITSTYSRSSAKENEKDGEKKEEKETEDKSQSKSIRERRRPREKRRSTGVSYWTQDNDENELEQQSDTEVEISRQTQNDAISRYNALSSSSDHIDYLLGRSGSNSHLESRKPYSNRLDKDDSACYKKLYEQIRAENEKLKVQLHDTNMELTELKLQLEKATQRQERFADRSLLEMEKRERRALERRISEMEEELKMLPDLKADNQRLKDENGALIRVISKLSK